MLPKWHILFGLLFSLILYFFFSVSLLNSSVVLLSSVIIDVDHYLFYVKRKKNWSLRKSYEWNFGLRKKHKPILHIFHVVEFIILICASSYFLNIFLFVFIGILFHSIFDLIEMIVYGGNGREFFLIRYLLTKNKNKYF